MTSVYVDRLAYCISVKLISTFANRIGEGRMTFAVNLTGKNCL